MMICFVVGDLYFASYLAFVSSLIDETHVLAGRREEGGLNSFVYVCGARGGEFLRPLRPPFYP